MRRGRITSSLRGYVFLFAVLAVVLGLIVSGLRKTDNSRSEETLRTTKDSLYRAAVSCYAIEGSYPATLDYLTSNYGVYIDEEKYYVDYVIFAENLMPDITVLEK